MKVDDPLILAFEILLRVLNFEIVFEGGVISVVDVSEICDGFFEFLCLFPNFNDVFAVCKAFRQFLDLSGNACLCCTSCS